MRVDKKIITVDVEIERVGYSLSEDALHTILFITEEVNPVKSNIVYAKQLKDLLDNGYRRDSVAYNFCLGVFYQKRGMRVIVANKAKGMSYTTFYSQLNIKNEHYFVCIESKKPNDVVSLHNLLVGIKPEKLLFTSTNQDLTKNYVNLDRLVYYYLSTIDDTQEDSNYLLYDSYSVVQTDSQIGLLKENNNG